MKTVRRCVGASESLHVRNATPFVVCAIAIALLRATSACATRASRPPAASSGVHARFDTFVASKRIRVQRSLRSSLSASTTLRLHPIATRRETPACVAPSSSVESRSPFGTANAIVISGVIGFASLRSMTSTTTSPPRERCSPSRADASVPRPSKSVTRSPTPSRRAPNAWRASSRSISTDNPAAGTSRT